MGQERYLVTFICTANVCRSPMAEGLLKHALQAVPELKNKVTVISAGISAFDGEEASQNSIQAMKNVGIDISQHRSQRLSQSIVDSSVAIFCMTSQHLALIQSLFSNLPQYVYLMRDFLPISPSSKDIADPFRQSLKQYEEARDSMLEVITKIVAFLKKNYS